MEETEFYDYYKSSYIYNDTYGFSYKDESGDDIVSDLVMGSLLHVTGSVKNHYKIKYPDGRQAIVKKNKLMPIEKFEDFRNDRNNLLANASKLIGIPYLWGGTSSKGFDCSGFVSYVYKKSININLPAGSGNQFASKDGVYVNYNELKPGDLMFFSNNGSKISHVAIYIDKEKFIHSPRSGRRISIENYSKYYRQRFVKGKSFVLWNLFLSYLLKCFFIVFFM